MTRRGGGAVCRPGRGGQQLKEGPVRETGWAITGAQNALRPRAAAAEAGAAGVSRSGQAPLPACWAVAHQLVPQAGAQSQSRLVGYVGNTSATEVLTCGDEEASVCYLSGEVLTPLWWIIGRCFSSQVNRPLQDQGKLPHSSPLSLSSEPGPLLPLYLWPNF